MYNLIRIANLKLAEVRKELQKRGLPVRGKKCDLVLRLKTELDSSFLPITEDIGIPANSATSISNNDLSKTVSGNLILDKEPCKPIIRNRRYYFPLTTKIRILEEKLRFLATSNTKLKKALDKAKHGNKYKPSIADNILNNSVFSIDKDQKPSHVLKTPTSRQQCQNISKATKQPGKILILGDSNSRDASRYIMKFLNSEYKVLNICKPNAKLEDVTSDIVQLTKDFNVNDFVIIIGGANNIIKGFSFKLGSIKDIVIPLNHTNVIFITVPYWRNKYIYNKLVSEFNTNLFKETDDTQYCKVIDINEVVQNQNRNFTRHGLHLNSVGKRKLWHSIALVVNEYSHYDNSYYVRKLHINTDNLIYINTSAPPPLNTSTTGIFNSTPLYPRLSELELDF